MAARDFPPFEATACQIAALLERYESDVDALASTWFDAQLYARVSRQVDELRRLCAFIPPFSVPWVQLLVSHMELMHALWRCNDGASDRQATAHGRNAVHAAAGAMRRKCLVHFSHALH